MTNREEIIEIVRKKGNCWYLDHDFIGQLPHKIQTRFQVKQFLQKEVDRRYPEKYKVKVVFKTCDKREGK